jgi:hypothetical protein
METFFEIKDDSDKTPHRTGILYNGSIESGGPERDYKNIVKLPNDVNENSDNTNNYIKVSGDEIVTNTVSISCWIKLIGTSSNSAPILINTDSEEKLSGLILNPNGNEFGIGYVWQMLGDESDNDFNVTIEPDKWTHIVLVIYRSGISRLFVDGKYKAMHDCGYIRNTITFDNIEIGKFSGLLDNVRFFSDTLDYGNVKLQETALNDVMYLYNENRADFVPRIPKNSDYITSLNNSFISNNQGLKFKYKQDDNYVKAHTSYLNNTLKVAVETNDHIKNIIKKQTSEVQDEQKITIKSGDPSYDGLRKFATGTFRTISGEIVDSN